MIEKRNYPKNPFSTRSYTALGFIVTKFLKRPILPCASEQPFSLKKSRFLLLHIAHSHSLNIYTLSYTPIFSLSMNFFLFCVFSFFQHNNDSHDSSSNGCNRFFLSFSFFSASTEFDCIHRTPFLHLIFFFSFFFSAIFLLRDC